MRPMLSPTLVLACLLAACRHAPPPSPSSPEPVPAREPAPQPYELPFYEPEPETPPLPRLDLREIAGVQYLEVVTGDAAPEAELPMIVVLQGNGYPSYTAHELLTTIGTTREPVPPFSATARVIFLRGTEPIDPPGCARWFSITLNEAQASTDRLTELSRQIEDRSQTVAAAITALVQARPTIGKPIVSGHSQGGLLAFALAVGHPELFDAAYPVSSWLPKPLWPRKRADEAAAQLPIIVMHGDADTSSSFEQTRLGVDHLQGLGYDITLIPYPGVSHSLIPMLAELRRRLADRVITLSNGEPP